MKVIKPFAVIVSFTPDLELNIEAAGRTCWKSEEKIEEGSAAPFIERIKGMQHESVLEHGAISVRFVCDRGVTHELVRHRVASFSQESTRYCNYSKGKFDGELSFIEPCFWDADSELMRDWRTSMRLIEDTYLEMLDKGATAQEARSVLPNSLKTEIVMTANPREWRHVFKMRCPQSAHPQMREVMLPLRAEFAKRWPSIFGDLLQ